MRNAIIGIIIGVVVGVAIGATVVAPRLKPAGTDASQDAHRTAGAPMPPAEPAAAPPAPPPEPEPAQPAAGAPAPDKTHPPFPEQAEAPPDPDPKSETGSVPEPAPAGKAAAATKAPESSPAQARPEASAPAGARPEAPGTTQGTAMPPAEAPAVPDVVAKAEPLPPEPEPIRWRMGSAYASTLPQLGTLAKKLDRDIWRVSDGELEIKFFEPGALVPPLEMFDAVRAGVIEAAFSSPGFWGNKVPALQLFAAVPFGPTAKEFLAWIYFGGGQALFEEIYHAYGIHSVFCGLIAPEASGWFRKRIRTVEDLKGLKMRFFGLGAKVMEKLGVATSRLTDGEIFVALESGAIDAAEFSMPAIDLKLGLHHMAKNYYFPGWHQPATFFELMINLEKWKQLPATQKAQIEAVCGDNIRYGLAEGEAAQFQALKALQAEGVHIRRWPSEILEALNAAWSDVAREEAKADKDFRRVWRSLSDFRRDYAIWQELSLPY